jgi:hypothetical protein
VLDDRLPPELTAGTGCDPLAFTLVCNPLLAFLVRPASSNLSHVSYLVAPNKPLESTACGGASASGVIRNAS